jgi:hypothetical protein
MNHSGDAAEQIVRMSLEGVEVAARITGAAAKELAVFLIAALKSDGNGKGKMKLKGRARLESMLKSGKPLEIFSVRERDLRTFVREAKRYGIVYCVLRNSKNAPDGLCDIMVKADDAPKINRLVERFKFAAVDAARIEREVARDMAESAAETPAGPAAPGAEAPFAVAEARRADAAAPPPIGAEPDAPEINDMDALLDVLLGADEGKPTPEMAEAERLEITNSPIGAAGGKSAPEPSETREFAPDAAVWKMEPAVAAPKKGRGRKKGAAPTADAQRTRTRMADGREQTGPFAGGGRTQADSPATDSPPPKASPSEPSSGSRKKTGRHTSSRPSVKAELREIAAAKKAAEADAPMRAEPAAQKPKSAPPPTHKQPPRGKKSKKSKGR